MHNWSFLIPWYLLLMQWLSLLVTQWCLLIYFVVSVTDAMMHMLSLVCDGIKSLYLTPLKVIEDVAVKVALK